MANADSNVKVALGGTDAQREEYISILAGAGFSVLEFDSCSELHDYVPELIILLFDDEKRLRECGNSHGRSEILANVPVLLVGEEDVLKKALSSFCGTVDIISPPLSREVLLRRINLLVDLRNKSMQIDGLSRSLQEAQRMECIGSIAAGVVHEFNNLMFALLGYAEMAQNDPDDIGVLRECADVALQVGKRASSVAASLKAMSLQAKGSISPQDINGAVKDALKLLKRYLEEHKVTVETDLQNVPMAEFSYGQMQQVMINLVINAVQAMDKVKGDKILKVETMFDGKSRIAVSVADNGKGIAEDSMDKIFTPFFTTKEDKGEGTAGGAGLGLSIVKEVVKQHGGVVHVDSKEGDGARFTVYLKIAEKDVVLEDGARLGVQGTMHPCKVLVIDDEESNLKMIVRILLKHGYDVCSSTSVHDAMAHFWSGDLDLIVMDLVMPKVDGAQCVSVLREDGIDTPILICTGVVDSPLIKQALDAGAQDVILKPFTAQELLEAIYKCTHPSCVQTEAQA